MSLQWTLVAGFLYAEIFLLVLFSVPFISAKQWNKLFKSRFLQVLSRQATWYFGLAFVILTMLLLDAIREMRKYSTKEQSEHSHLENELQISMRLFRAQRNFYISGFALFLSLVIKKFAGMISTVAQLEAENEAVMKQAKSASAAASALMKGSGETAQNASNEAHQQEMNKLKEELEAAKKKLTTVEKDRDAVVSQAKSLEKEYDRLNEEHHKLQLKLKISEGDKKDD